MPEKTIVRLAGGPFDGHEVEATPPTSVLMEGGEVANGMVARYRPTLDRGVYRFRGYDQVVARILMPGAAAA